MADDSLHVLHPAEGDIRLLVGVCEMASTTSADPSSAPLLKNDVLVVSQVVGACPRICERYLECGTGAVQPTALSRMS